MALDRYRLLAQLGAGSDGISYRAAIEDEARPGDGAVVEVRDLVRARADARRWEQLVPRLRLSARLEHPSSIRVLDVGLDGEPPYIVLPWAGTTIQGRARRDAGAAADPFAEPDHLPAPRRERLERLLDRLAGRGVDARVVGRLGEHLAVGSPQEVARIRPLALAERFGLDPDQVVTACLHGAREGLLELHWDLLCPVCRISCQITDTLRAIAEHAHCAACHLDFPLDFANSIELIFRVHPEIRRADLGTYCLGGPSQSPHVPAQVRVAPGERIELELELTEGTYRLRGPQLPWTEASSRRRLAATSPGLRQRPTNRNHGPSLSDGPQMRRHPSHEDRGAGLMATP